MVLGKSSHLSFFLVSWIVVDESKELHLDPMWNQSAPLWLLVPQCPKMLGSTIQGLRASGGDLSKSGKIASPWPKLKQHV